MKIDKEVFYLTLVRHGQTIANAQKIIQGFSDTPLTEFGVDQAKELGKFFRSNCEWKQFDKVYSSDLGRALSTCKIITEYCGLSERVIEEDSRLRERKYGDKYEGKSIRSFQLEAFEQGFDESTFTQYTPEGVESMSGVQQRVIEFIESLCQEYSPEDEILVVSHWGTIKEFLKLFEPSSDGCINRAHFIESPNTAYCRFQIGCNTGTGDVISKKIQKKFIASVKVVSLHQTLHITENKKSCNMKQSLD